MGEAVSFECEGTGLKFHALPCPSSLALGKQGPLVLQSPHSEKGIMIVL